MSESCWGMRRMVLAALVAISAPAGAAPRLPAVQAAVDSVPALGSVARGRTRITVRGNLGKAKQRELVALADHVVTDVTRRFLATGPGDPRPDVTLCLLADDATYRRVASAFGRIPSDWGFYRGDQRVALANVGVSIGNLRHELAHPLVGDDFPNIPTWLNEGIGALYGSAEWRAGRFEFVVNYRLRDLQRALAAGTLPTLAELAGSQESDVHGERASVYYAMGRYVLLYLDRKGTLGKLYAQLRAAPDDVTVQRAILLGYVDDKAFRAWAKQLRY